MRSVTAARRSPTGDDLDALWRERAGRLYEELQAPARAMVRRAYRNAFSDDEIHDAYSSAWLGTLRALARRQAQLDDEEIRKYVLTAVAHQASKELRRRGRKPTAPLENAGAVADVTAQPDERMAQVETSQVTRDLLSSLPRRRRAVLMLRYGWGLEPAQVCALVKGLSPRAYRKEITRGIDDLTERIRRLEQGEWCADREPILKSYAAGLADGEERRQAEHHLAHCRHCTEFVGKLSGHLHDIGGAAASVPGAFEAVHDGRLHIADRISDGLDRLRAALPGGSPREPAATLESTAQLAGSGGLRGGGAAGAGVLAKLTGLGAVGKVAVACVTGGVAASCVVAGVGPLALPRPDSENPAREASAGVPHQPPVQLGPGSSPVAQNAEAPAEPPPPVEDPVSGEPPPPAPAPEPEPAPLPPPPAPEQEFGLAPATTSTSGGSTSSSSSSGGGGGGSAAQREFGL